MPNQCAIMRIPSGHQTVLATESPSIDAISVKNGTLFLTLSTDTVTLWHAATLLPLSSIRRVTDSLESAGFNRRLFLREDDMMVIVQTTGSVIIVYDLCETSNAEERIYATEVSIGAPKVWLKHRQNIRVEAAVQSLCATSERLILVTKKPAMIQTMNWASTGGEILTRSYAISKMAFLHADGDKTLRRIIDVVHSSSHDIYLFIMSDSSVFVAESRNDQWAGRLLQNTQHEASRAIMACFHDALGVISIAMSNKQILSYVIPPDMVTSIEHLTSYDHKHMQGSLRSMSWSSEGDSLLLCTEHGWSLVSSVAQTIAESKLSIPVTAVTEKSVISYDQGAIMLLAIWISGGYSALFVPLTDSHLQITEFLVQNSCTLRSPKRLHYRWQSSALSFLHQNNGIDPWKQLTIPLEMAQFGPLLFSSVSSCQKYIAVGAKHGLGFYDAVQDRWIIHKEHQGLPELALLADPIWYQHFLVVATEQQNYGQELRLLSRKLELEDVLDRVKLSEPVVAIASRNEWIYICYSTHNVEQYQIVRTKSNALRLLLRSKHNLYSAGFRKHVSIRSLSVLHEAGSKKTWCSLKFHS